VHSLVDAPGTVYVPASSRLSRVSARLWDHKRSAIMPSDQSLADEVRAWAEACDAWSNWDAAARGPSSQDLKGVASCLNRLLGIFCEEGKIFSAGMRSQERIAIIVSAFLFGMQCRFLSQKRVVAASCITRPSPPPSRTCAGGIAAVQKIPQATKLLARLLKVEVVLLSEAADPLFRCMMHLLPSFAGAGDAPESAVFGDLVGRSAGDEARARALLQRSEQWCCERLHAAVRGTRTDPCHPLNAASSGCLPQLQEWLYDCGVSHSDIQEVIAEEAAAALHEALHTPLKPAALEHLPVLSDLLSQASTSAEAPRMTMVAEEMLRTWSTFRASDRTGSAVSPLQPLLVPVGAHADVHAATLASSDAFVAQSVAHAAEAIADEAQQWHRHEARAALSAQVRLPSSSDIAERNPKSETRNPKPETRNPSRPAQTPQSERCRQKSQNPNKHPQPPTLNRQPPTPNPQPPTPKP
jgi:hypothetical protein